MSTPTHPGIDEEQRDKNRQFAAEHYARFREMTRLEQAAYKTRSELGEGYRPYTPAELEEAEAIRRLTSELQARADMLNQRITKRLRGQAGSKKGVESLLFRFESMKDTRIELRPF